MRFGVLRQSYRFAVHHFGDNYKRAYHCSPALISAALPVAYTRLHPQTLQLINRSAINLASLSSVIHELAMAGKSSEIACFGESLAELLTGISSLTRANKNTRIRFFTNGMANEIRGRLPMYDEIISTVRAVGCYAEAVFCDILLVTRHIASKEKQQLSAFSFY